METGRPPNRCALLLLLYLSALILPGRGEDPRLQIYQEEPPLQSNSLAVALGEMLEYNDPDGGVALEKKAVQVPRVRMCSCRLQCMMQAPLGHRADALFSVQCDVGERCALKHGPRIGKLCDCLRGASCNSFMLRCY
ncbi:cocaine- and amphetamine-regulated transcript protein-like isoform X1 [Bufo gargarizans]|uniref:cocaine- and amphetamine-regulated transcript protein-like isoform X1 n=1 Tax=Bufo gargarizans TaxID=30331 RepID=UPI001CF1FC0E|nr:cocaine- and amphetamine-regulated transcript protein-like isoform X1 [Bufo gargarizans]